MERQGDMNDMFRIEIEDVARRESALATMLKQMDVPEFRHDTSKVSNLRWLNRNLTVHNGQHPLFQTAAEMTLWLLKWHHTQ